MNDNVSFITFISICGAIAITFMLSRETEHEKRMNLIKEQRELYEIRKDIEFDKSYNDICKFVDSLQRKSDEYLSNNN